MIVNDSSCSNVRDSWNYHQLSSTIMTVWTGLYARALSRKPFRASSSKDDGNDNDTKKAYYWLNKEK